MAEKEVGLVNEFFAHVMVGGIELSDTLKVGDRIHVKGHTTDQEFNVASMQINNKNVNEAKKGESVGVKVPERVRPGDKVYLVTE